MDTAQLRTYELTYLLPGSLMDNEVAQVRSEVEQLLKKAEATITKNEDWGRKQLAYVIRYEGKKNIEGVYTHLVFTLDPLKAPGLDHDVYLANKVMRHLMVVSDGEDVENTK